MTNIQQCPTALLETIPLESLAATINRSYLRRRKISSHRNGSGA